MALDFSDHDEMYKNDENRTIKGKPYQLFLFEISHHPDMYDINAETEDASALMGRIESDTPFMSIHVGDFLDGRPLGFDYGVLMRVERIEHQINVFHTPMRHRIALFVRNVYRQHDFENGIYKQR